MINTLVLLIKNNFNYIRLFLTVGAISAIVYFGLFAIAWSIFHIPYKIAVSISYISSAIFHFNANRYFTFKSHHIHFTKQIFRYLTMIFINYSVTLGIVYIIVDKLFLSPYIGIVCSIAVTMNMGFLMSRYWIFNPSRKHS